MTPSEKTETLVGAAVVGIAGLFLLYAGLVTGRNQASFSGGYGLTADFDNAEGINVGSDVRIAGIKIGSVTGQTLNKESYQATLQMQIDSSIALAEDTTAKITSEGLLGGRFISLEPGGSETKLTDGGVISFTQGAVDLWSLISQAMFEKTGNKGGAEGAAPAPDQPPAEQPAENQDPQ
jgi:phospholipid/cholesterol/gamma-HCH transport system substrate-binding protein